MFLTIRAAATPVLIALLCVLALGAGAPRVLADDLAARKQAAVELINMTVTGPMSDQMAASVWPVVETVVKKKNPGITAAQLQGLKQTFVEMNRENIAHLIPTVADFYAQEFTLHDLNTLKDFYKTETGQKALTLMPKLTGMLMPKLMAQIKKQMPRLLTELKKVAKERGIDM